MITAKHIRESNLIEGIDDPRADAQSMIAYRWLMKHSGLNHHTICYLQKLITVTQDNLSQEQRGRYRTVNVKADGRECPVPGLIIHLMNNWILDYKELSPKEAHIRFEQVHPFVDGNGRTGRMLMWWQEDKIGQTPTLIRSNEADKYYYFQWFKESSD